jgi:hypothetical protein
VEDGDAGLRANGMRVGDEPQGRAEERVSAIWKYPWRKPLVTARTSDRACGEPIHTLC